MGAEQVPEVILQDDSIADDNQVDDATVNDDTQNDDSKIVDDDISEPTELSLEDKLKASNDEVVELRQMIREQRRSMNDIKEGLITDPVEDDVEDNLDDDESARVNVAPEVTKEDIHIMQTENNLESMRMSDKYGDVDTVVTQRRFDDLVEIMADNWMIANPGSNTKDEVIAGVEQQIWSNTSAHRLMYDKIKETHPDFAKPKIAPKVPLNKDDVAPSINNLDGGRQGLKTGWTADKIDNLPEDRLGEVPKDIYNLYLQEKLK